MDSFIALLALLVVDALLVYGSCRFGMRWLLCAIITNLFLANMFGSQFVDAWGWSVNVGNVLYAFVFLATQCFLELHGRERIRPFEPLWIGLLFMTAFLLIVESVTILTSNAFSLSSLLAQPYSFIELSFVRVTFASLLAYFFAQYFHITWYLKLKTRWDGRFVLLRSLLTNSVVQGIDTLIFFTFAFTDASASVLLRAFFVGWLVKVVVVAVWSPLLYAKASHATE